MLRKVLAVVIGYIIMAIVIMGGLTLVYLALGADRVFKPGNYEITTIWYVVWAAGSILAALIGGMVCAKISKHSKGAVISLMILILVFGAANAGYLMTRPDPAPEDLVRDSETPNFEAMTKAQAPIWMYIAEPIMGFFGVMIGATLVCPKHGPGAGKSSESSGEE